MEVETLISVQLKSTVILVAITLNPFATPKDVGIDVKVKVIKAMWLWNSGVGNVDCKYEDIIPIKKGDDVEGKFYRNWNFIRMLLKLNFPHQNRFIKFPLPKTLLPKIDFYYQFWLCISRTDFLGIRVTSCSIVFLLLSWRYLRLCPFVDYTEEYFLKYNFFFLQYFCM